MKKLFIIAMTVLANIVSFAQNYDTLYIVDHHGETIEYCTYSNDGVIVCGRPECPQNEFAVNGESIYEDFVLLPNNGEPQYFFVTLRACGAVYGCSIYFKTPSVTNPFAEPFVWKRTGESVTLHAPGNVLWSTGETTNEITVTEPGTYSVTITDACGSETYPIEVGDNVEVELATCDLESNMNMVIWQTTPEQAEYVSQVEVKRDGLTVGTVPYTDGQFIDNIGSDAASRTYTVTAIATDGTPCPIESYPKETIHMAYLTGINNTIEVNWNAPTGYDLLGYNICEWTPGAKDGDLTVIDYVGAAVTSYTCSESQFNQGNIVVQGVENGRTESRLLSNRSWETVGLGEHEEAATFSVYPNPSNGVFTVEGTGMMTVTNIVGQTIHQQEIDGVTPVSLNLRAGYYFLTVGLPDGASTTKKLIVR